MSTKTSTAGIAGDAFHITGVLWLANPPHFARGISQPDNSSNMESVTMSRRLHENPQACGRVLEDTDWYGMVKHRDKRLSVADLSRELEHYARTIFWPITVTS